ncbi:MAG: hypothetical protein ABNH26_11585 [Celeribacter sp.]|jgi:outer membrane murein-binding lipoprotein Lpp
MNMFVVTAVLSSVLLAGCAENADNIEAAYISPVQYENYSCRKLSAEAQRVSARASQAIGTQNKKAGNDAAATAVGMVLFWPALFFIDGDGASAAEVSRLKGEMEAIEQASIQRGCGISFQTKSVAAK